MSKCQYISSNELEVILSKKMYSIIVFGASKYAETIIEILEYKNINISYYADNDKKKWGELFHGKEIIDSKCINDIKNPLVIVASSYYEQIVRQLKELQVESICIITDYLCYSYNEAMKEKKELKDYFNSYEKLKGNKILIKAFDGIGDNIIKLGIYNEILKNYSIDNIYIAVYKKSVYELLKLFTDKIIYIDPELFNKDKNYRTNMLRNINGYYFKLSINFTSIKLSPRHCLLCENNTNIVDNYNNYDDYDTSNSEYVLDSQISLAKKVFDKLSESNFSPKNILNNKILNIKIPYELPQNYICTSMGSFDDKRRYPLDKFVNILNHMIDKNMNVILLGDGSKDDDYYLEALSKIKDKSKIINLSSKLKLPETLKVILMSKFYLGVDSGLAHCAYILDKKSIVLIGGGHYGKYMHKDKNMNYITNKLECFGCGWTGCSDIKCVKEIDEKDVITMIEKLEI